MDMGRIMREHTEWRITQSQLLAVGQAEFIVQSCDPRCRQVTAESLEPYTFISVDEQGNSVEIAETPAERSNRAAIWNAKYTDLVVICPDSTWYCSGSQRLPGPHPCDRLMCVHLACVMLQGYGMSLPIFGQLFEEATEAFHRERGWISVFENNLSPLLPPEQFARWNAMAELRR